MPYVLHYITLQVGSPGTMLYFISAVFNYSETFRPPSTSVFLASQEIEVESPR